MLKHIYLSFLALCICLASPSSTLDAAKQSKKPQHYLAMAATFKDEARFLKEWIEYHRLVGVEHFYLYNNNTTDNSLEVLQPYVEEGLVTVIDWPRPVSCPDDHNNNQHAAFEHCIKNYSCTWLAMNDTDEFLVTKTGDLPALLRQYENRFGVGGLYINWYFFGTSYVNEIPADQLLIETLTMRGENIDIIGKCIVRPDRVLNIPSVHAPKFKFGFHGTYADGHLCDNPFKDPYACEDLIWINHYWSRDYKNFIEKKTPPEQKYSTHAKVTEFTENFITETFNKVEDTRIQRYVPELRRRMGFDSVIEVIEEIEVIGNDREVIEDEVVVLVEE